MTDGDEWWDIVDAGGTPTGAVFRRGAPQWPAGGFHLIAAVCVQREDGMVLLTRCAASALLDVYVSRAGPAAEVTLQATEVMASEGVAPEEVVRRLAAGAMAAPWTARLNCLWPSIRHALTRAP